MKLQFNLKNTGHSPARRAFVAFIPLITSNGADTRQRACRIAEGGVLGLAIFPDEAILQGVGAIIREDDFVKFRDQYNKAGGKIPEIFPSIIACIAYQDMETENFHHTPYDFFLSLPDGHSSPLSMLLNHGVIHANDLALVSMPVSLPPD